MTQKYLASHINFRAFSLNKVSIVTVMPTVLKNAIRDIKDFPKPGIVFKDITPILSDPVLFQHSIDLFLEKLKGQEIDKVVGIDARGFIFGAPLALALGAGFIPVRKKGKLPSAVISEAYSLEYGQNEIEMHKDAIQPGEKVVLIDDLLATGGTASASWKLLKKLQANIVGVHFLIELTFLNGRAELPSQNVHALISY